MPTLKLTYFDTAGRAEPLRIALRMGGVAFEDHRLGFADFRAAQAAGAFPLSQVPVLEVDGAPITQTGAMLRYAARLGDAGLYPADPHTALLVDSALDSFNDTLTHALMPSMVERDPDKKLAMRAEIAAGPLARIFAYTEGLIARSGGPFVGGSALSIADLVIAFQISTIQRGILDGITAEVLAPYPRLLALTEAVFADPRVQAARS